MPPLDVLAQECPDARVSLSAVTFGKEQWKARGQNRAKAEFRLGYVRTTLTARQTDLDL